MNPKAHNVGAYIAAVDAGVVFSSVAAGTNDNTEKAGVIIDRLAHEFPLSMSLLIAKTATLSANKALNVGYRIETGDDSALADTADLVNVTPANGSVLASVAGGTVTGTDKIDFDLGGAKRYVRVNIKSDLSATATDTAIVAAAVVFGGEQVNPAV